MKESTTVEQDQFPTRGKEETSAASLSSINKFLGLSEEEIRRQKEHLFFGWLNGAGMFGFVMGAGMSVVGLPIALGAGIAFGVANGYVAYKFSQQSTDGEIYTDIEILHQFSQCYQQQLLKITSQHFFNPQETATNQQLPAFIEQTKHVLNAMCPQLDQNNTEMTQGTMEVGQKLGQLNTNYKNRLHADKTPQKDIIKRTAYIAASAVCGAIGTALLLSNPVGWGIAIGIGIGMGVAALFGVRNYYKNQTAEAEKNKTAMQTKLNKATEQIKESMQTIEQMQSRQDTTVQKSTDFSKSINELDSSSQCSTTASQSSSNGGNQSGFFNHQETKPVRASQWISPSYLPLH